MSRRGESRIPATDALRARIGRWLDHTASEDRNERAINALSLAIGRKVNDQLQTGLMTSKFLPTWLEAILQLIKKSAKKLHEEGGNANDLSGTLIAEVAALRFESLELKERIRVLNKR